MKFLLQGHNFRIVPLAATGSQPLLPRDDLHGTITAVGLECGWVVRNHVLITEGLFDAAKRGRQLAFFMGFKQDAPGGGGQFLQHVVAGAIRVVAGVIGAQGKDHNLGSRRFPPAAA